MSQQTHAIVDHGKSVLIGNYARLPVVMVRGEGSRLWDVDGKPYLDLFAGFGAGIVGHCHPELIAAVKAQAEKLWHVGNQFYTTPQIDFADALGRTAFPGKAFFCHSGLEANEAAVKLAKLRGGPTKWKTISLNRSFHGRSMAMIAATGNPNVKAGFEPMVPGFTNVEPGDLDAVVRAVDDETAAIIVEPIQGEGGIYPLATEYVAGLRKLCDDRGMTLIFDEVWTGGGRTGRWFGHQYFTGADGKVITPDIMTLGKAVGGGLPVGVMWARPEVADPLTPGRHGCTLGGNPICMAAAAAVFQVIERDRLTDHAAVLGEHGMARLRNEKRIAAKVAGVRGRGLMIGVELKVPPERLVERGLELGVNVNLTSKSVVRLAPPINISLADWDEGLDRVVDLIAAV
jgi:predicted acetylornithine/succinylornithine family transaminase